MVALHTPYLKPPSWLASYLFGDVLAEGETQARAVATRELVPVNWHYRQTSLSGPPEYGMGGSRVGSSPGATFTRFSPSFPRPHTAPAVGSLKWHKTFPDP